MSGLLSQLNTAATQIILLRSCLAEGAPNTNYKPLKQGLKGPSIGYGGPVMADRPPWLFGAISSAVVNTAQALHHAININI